MAIPDLSIDDLDFQLRERLIAAEERKAEALISIAMQMPALIDALQKRSTWGGKKTELGLLKLPPTDLSAFEPNSTFKNPVIGYYVKGSNRVAFFSPYNENGEIVEHPGVVAGTIEIGGKTWEKLFKNWQPNTSGSPVRFADALRLVTFSVGADKEDKAKRFKFIVGITKAETIDPDTLTYTAPPSAKTE